VALHVIWITHIGGSLHRTIALSHVKTWAKLIGPLAGLPQAFLPKPNSV